MFQSPRTYYTNQKYNLGDPELELIDPTPNVHSLFLQFDKLFFDTKLSSRAVSVRWSKRMYSCAGICSYEGRGGLCSIALSEPLLKLRPRKDLIETLLHEMIHAFLFVTCRDQDRDGHGPNFKAHMYRINQAAALNITIYHSFHDEVELYQTHWWRCNGPCQTRRPHFGIVRRSANIAPGPRDRWWADHNRKCGGTFIKFKEPEKKGKKITNPKTKITKPGADITKFITRTPKTTAKTPNMSKPTLINTIQSIKPPKAVLKDSNNIPVAKPSSCNKVVTFNPESLIHPIPFSDRGQKTTGRSQNSNDVIDTVRNVWANKQLPQIVNNNAKVKPVINPVKPVMNSVKPVMNSEKPVMNPVTKVNPKKHKIDTSNDSTPSKMLKTDNESVFKLSELSGIDYETIRREDGLEDVLWNVDCPICGVKIRTNFDNINAHVDECLNQGILKEIYKDSLPSTSYVVNEFIFKKPAVASSIQSAKVETKTDLNSNINEQENKEDNRVTVKSIFSNDARMKSDRELKNKPDNNSNSNNETENMVSFIDLTHFGEVKIKTEAEPKTNRQKCACCNNTIDTTLDEHLENCLAFFDNNTTIPEEGLSTSFSGDVIEIDDENDDLDESQTFNETGTKYPCPCCLQMIEETEMNGHLDECLG